jgi:hypothetical protein
MQNVRLLCTVLSFHTAFAVCWREKKLAVIFVFRFFFLPNSWTCCSEWHAFSSSIVARLRTTSHLNKHKRKINQRRRQNSNLKKMAGKIRIELVFSVKSTKFYLKVNHGGDRCMVIGCNYSTAFLEKDMKSTNIKIYSMFDIIYNIISCLI